MKIFVPPTSILPTSEIGLAGSDRLASAIAAALTLQRPQLRQTGETD